MTHLYIISQAATATDIPSFAAVVIGMVGVAGVAGIVGVFKRLGDIKDLLAELRTDIEVIRAETKGDRARLEAIEHKTERLDKVYHWWSRSEHAQARRTEPEL